MKRVCFQEITIDDKCIVCRAAAEVFGSASCTKRFVNVIKFGSKAVV